MVILGEVLISDIGMLAGEESIKIVAETLKKYGIEKTVIDPVCDFYYYSQIRVSGLINYRLWSLPQAPNFCPLPP